MESSDTLLKGPPVVVNVGLPEFADALRLQKASFVHVDWSPPVEPDDEELRSALEGLLG